MIFLRVLLLVEPMFSERTYIAICLMLTFTVDVLEGVRTVFFFFYLKSWGVSFEIHLATLCHVPMVFNLVRTITFDVIGTMCMAYKDSMASFSAVFALENIKVHVCFTNSCNVAFYVKALVNKIFSLRTTLSILYIDPDNCYVLRNTLITWGQYTRMILLKMCGDWMIFSTISVVIRVEESLIK